MVFFGMRLECVCPDAVILTPPKSPRIVPMFRICWCVPVRWEWPPVSPPQWEASHAHFYPACIALYHVYALYIGVQNIIFIPLSSPFSCLVCLSLVGMCVKLWFAFHCDIERIHKIVYSLNPFVFPLLLFIHHSLYFFFHSAVLFLLYFSLPPTQCTR